MDVRVSLVNVILVRPEFKKLPIVVTFGSVNVFRALQAENAISPITVRAPSTVTLARLVHP